MVSLKEMARYGPGAQQPSHAALVVPGARGGLALLWLGRAAASARCGLGVRQPWIAAAWAHGGLSARPGACTA